MKSARLVTLATTKLICRTRFHRPVNLVPCHSCQPDRFCAHSHTAVKVGRIANEGRFVLHRTIPFLADHTMYYYNTITACRYYYNTIMVCTYYYNTIPARRNFESRLRPARKVPHVQVPHNMQIRCIIRYNVYC